MVIQSCREVIHCESYAFLLGLLFAQLKVDLVQLRQRQFRLIIDPSDQLSHLCFMVFQPRSDGIQLCFMVFQPRSDGIQLCFMVSQPRSDGIQLCFMVFQPRSNGIQL